MTWVRLQASPSPVWEHKLILERDTVRPEFTQETRGLEQESCLTDWTMWTTDLHFMALAYTQIQYTDAPGCVYVSVCDVCKGVHTHAYTHAYANIYDTRVHTLTHTHPHMDTHRHVHTRWHILKCTRAHTHRHAHTLTHACI